MQIENEQNANENYYNEVHDKLYGYFLEKLKESAENFERKEEELIEEINNKDKMISCLEKNFYDLEERLKQETLSNRNQKNVIIIFDF